MTDRRYEGRYEPLPQEVEPMNIGIVGAGKLGMPVALAVESQGHNVAVFDTNPDVAEYVAGTKPYPHQEQYVEEQLAKTNLTVCRTLGELVLGSDLVFCAIQTPHEARFEGSTRLPDDRADFDYTHLTSAVAAIAREAQSQQKQTTLAVISTCLPGTYEREIKPLLNPYIDYVYNPLYIAMGTVMEDYLNPEFVLIGQEDEPAREKLEEFYDTLHRAPHVVTDITTAEGIKVSYNTWITAKTVLANAWGEMCERLGMNFDDMYKAWSLATDRLISPRYMQAGVGDGGGCHPRDNIALSYIADEVGMSHNIWEDLMKAREAHMNWLAMEGYRAARDYDLPLVLLGRSFKPETNIETGSPAILASNILQEGGISHQHYEDIDGVPQKAVYLITTKHERYADFPFPKGSIVIDPFRIIKKRDGVIVKAVGRKTE